MKFHVLTIFPDFFASPLKSGIIGKAIEKGVFEVNLLNIRDFTTDRHRTTDDYPYGGGCGMVMKVEPVARAIESIPHEGKKRIILTTPQGTPFNQALAKELSGLDDVTVICGRYEGVDERVRAFADIEVSAGDYVLTGGEAIALGIIDAVGRLIPGVLGNEASSEEDSFSNGLLEHPQYTRPEMFRGVCVPEILLSGNHAGIERWRRQESIKRTFLRRPELLSSAELSREDAEYVEALKRGAASAN
ncbi:MAG: tRNA (guanosine(37)-N1)-methyltransferase TrmD [Deltaproteobacteria bacterium]